MINLNRDCSLVRDLEFDNDELGLKGYLLPAGIPIGFETYELEKFNNYLGLDGSGRVSHNSRQKILSLRSRLHPGEQKENFDFWVNFQVGIHGKFLLLPESEILKTVGRGLNRFNSSRIEDSLNFSSSLFTTSDKSPIFQTIEVPLLNGPEKLAYKRQTSNRIYGLKSLINLL